MKLSHCLALMALVFVIVVTSINCVQNNTPQPSPTPAATPTPVPAPSGSLNISQQLSTYNTAIADPYVRDRIIKTAWRNAQGLTTTTSYLMGNVSYMSFRETGPDFERTRVLPAAMIIPGNASQAGVNLIAFVDPDLKRVAYIGFVPRPGVPPAPGTTFASVSTGVDEHDATGAIDRSYNNVTVVNTGYIKGMSLSQDQKDQASRLAMSNATVQGYIGSNQATMGNFSVYSFETGYPDRYILTYPEIIIEVTDGPTRLDMIYILLDLINNRVVRVEHGEQFLF